MKLFVICFTLLSQFVVAQCDSHTLYTEADKEAFVKSYLSLKDEKPVISDTRMFEWFDSLNITVAEIREINDITANKLSLTAKQEAFANKVDVLKNSYNVQYGVLQEEVCKANGISKNTYLEIKQLYRSCIKFQRSLSDYFNKWM